MQRAMSKIQAETLCVSLRGALAPKQSREITRSYSEQGLPRCARNDSVESLIALMLIWVVKFWAIWTLVNS